MTVYHGAIVTVNANDDVFQYLVEHRGRIVYVGDTLPKKYRRVPVVELGSRALIPPFADTHQHFASLPIPMNSRATGCLISRSRS